MSYQKIGIDQLSQSQMGKFLRGLPTTIKNGTAHAIAVSGEQLKRAGKAFAMGRGLRIQLDPYQIDMHHHLHGQGFMSSIKKAANKVKQVYNTNKAKLQPLLHEYGTKAINMVSNKVQPLAAQYGLQNALDVAQDMAHENLEGTGIGRRRLQRGGSFKSVMKKVGSVAKSALKNPAIRSLVTSGLDTAAMSAGMPVPPGSSEMALKLAGLGMRPGRGRPRLGGALFPPGSR